MTQEHTTIKIPGLGRVEFYRQNRVWFAHVMDKDGGVLHLAKPIAGDLARDENLARGLILRELDGR